MARKGFIISVYNRIDDLLAHLDILKFYPYPHEIIITHFALPEHYLRQLQDIHLVQIPEVGFKRGPLFSLAHGLRRAHELKLDYVCYRNADDWLFNHEFTEENFRRLDRGECLCSGYNWISVGTHLEFAMNELYLDCEPFYACIDQAEGRFAQSSKLLCEFRIAEWVNKALGNWKHFHRLPGRERYPGIGHDWGALLYLFQHVINAPVPPDLAEDYKDNNRFFNREWQLIGSHHNQERLRYWRELQVPYARELERQSQFARWLEVAQGGGVWNLPNSEDHIENRKPRNLIKRRIIRHKCLDIDPCHR